MKKKWSFLYRQIVNNGHTAVKIPDLESEDLTPTVTFIHTGEDLASSHHLQQTLLLDLLLLYLLNLKSKRN